VYEARRDGMAKGHAGAAEYLDCAKCARYQEWNCGFLPRLPQHPGQYPLPRDAPRPESDTCPGYLIQLPLAQEALRAHLHWDKGQLDHFVGRERPSPHLLELVEVAACAVSEMQAARMNRDRDG
jgi:hypothetical protein